jgi:hypothetical protein
VNNFETEIQRIAGGSIDYQFYEARARSIRSADFTSVFITVRRWAAAGLSRLAGARRNCTFKHRVLGRVWAGGSYWRRGKDSGRSDSDTQGAPELSRIRRYPFINQRSSSAHLLVVVSDKR